MTDKEKEQKKKEASVALLLLRINDKMETRVRTVRGDLYSAVDQIDIELTNLRGKARREGWTHDELLVQSDVQINRLKRYTKDGYSGLGQTAFVAYGALSFANTLEQQLVWETQSGNVCPDCDALHGEKRTYAEWLATVMPGSGATVCGGKCQCVLVDVAEASANPVTIKRKDGKVVSVYEKTSKPVMEQK